MFILRFWRLLLVLFSTISAALGQDLAARQQLVNAVLTEDASEQIRLVGQLVTVRDAQAERALAAWRLGELYLLDGADGAKIPVLMETVLDSEGKGRVQRVLDGEWVKDASGIEVRFVPAELTPADTTSRLRRAIKATLDLYALSDPAIKIRRDAAIKLGQEQNPEYLPYFAERLKTESVGEVRKALEEGMALTQAASPDADTRKRAIQQLGKLRSLSGVGYLQDLVAKGTADPARVDKETLSAAKFSVGQIERYQAWGNLLGTAFRGLSLAAVLLVAALGLAITFGLMGVINMAHGELMMVGAYTAFVTQNMFRSWFGPGDVGLDLYFLAAVPLSFVAAAAVGVLLERGVIRFLYKRPLESLLATWGVSLLLQQIFRHVFGAANVQVSSPSWLSGSFVFNDVLFAYNRLFVIAFAVFIVVGTWLILTRTPLGLQVRAVMQNRAMAACVGVRTDRVNLFTFAFGSGLAGMAGACLSQIGNVGPSLGQNYIVDCFMIVVLGGVGSLFGTVYASLGVGVTDQILQPWLGAVLGKISVLCAIILFLQWRPSGLFATRGRGLEG